jgi:hypothetical protein
MCLSGLPSVGLRRFAAGTWKNLVQLFKSCFMQHDFRGVEGGLQLLDDSGSDCGRSHDGVVQKPSQGHGGGRFAQLLAQGLVLFKPEPVFVDFLQGLLAGATPAFQLLQGSAQKATAQRAPGISPNP